MAEVQTILTKFEVDISDLQNELRQLQADFKASQKAGQQSAEKVEQSEKELGAEVKKVTDSVQKQGSEFTKTGKQGNSAVEGLTKNLKKLAAGGAIAAAAVQAIKYAKAVIELTSRIEENFSQIENLVGVTGPALEELRQGVQAVSIATGKSQEDLSAALFAITSAGLRGADALEVLEQSAKASVVGLGEARDIALATGAVVQAYGSDNISAAEATDILTATIREGNLEASSFAPVIGRVVGLAAQLGVGFDELGANVATYTRLGVSAEQATTGLEGILRAINKPTDDAKKALGEVNLTFEDLRKKIREDGLAAALVELTELYGDNTEALGRVIPESTAFANVLGTASAQGEEYVRIANSIANSTGILDGAYDSASKTIKNQYNIAVEQLNAILIRLGNATLPYLNDLLTLVNSGLSLLSKTTKELATDNFELVKSQTQEIESITKLTDRYDKLTSQTTLTKSEKRELTTITLELESQLGKSVTAINKETGELLLNRAEITKQIAARAALQSEAAQNILAQRAILQAAFDEQERQRAVAAAGLDALLEQFPKTLLEGRNGWRNVTEATRQAEGSTSDVIIKYNEFTRQLGSREFGDAAKEIEELDNKIAALGIDLELLATQKPPPPPSALNTIEQDAEDAEQAAKKLKKVLEDISAPTFDEITQSIIDDFNKTFDGYEAELDARIKAIRERAEQLALRPEPEDDVTDPFDTSAFLDRQGIALSDFGKTYEDFAQEINEANKDIIAESIGAFGGIGKSLAEAFGLSAEASKAFLAFEKLSAITQVIIALSRELALINANPALNLIDPFTGTSLKVAYASQAKTRAAINIATIAATAIPEFAFATGTADAPGGLSLVGEKGPEIMQVPKGARIFTAEASKRERPLIEALNRGDVEDYIRDVYVAPALMEASVAPQVIQNTTSNMTFDDFQLRQAIRANKVIELGDNTISKLKPRTLKRLR